MSYLELLKFINRCELRDKFARDWLSFCLQNDLIESVCFKNQVDILRLKLLKKAVVFFNCPTHIAFK